MRFVKNILSYCLFSLLIAGCGGGNTTITSNYSANDTNNSSPGGNTQNNPGSGSTSSVTLSWSAPTTWADSTAASLADISAYRLYYGDSPGNTTSHSITIADPTATQYTITLPSGTYYFQISAIDTNQIEGLKSSVLQKNF